MTIGAGAVSAWVWNSYISAGPLAQSTIVHIKRGSGMNSIAHTLYKHNVISDPLVMRIMARLSKQHLSLKAGEYEFPAGISMQDALNKIVGGDVYLRSFTVAEGLTSWQVVQVLNDIQALEGEIETIPDEGSLLPETYSYEMGATKQEQILHMQQSMAKTIDSLWDGRDQNLPLQTKEEAIILASIVEKETGIHGERKKIAGVFINRLRKNMALQTDPTVIYALTGGKIQNNGQGPLGRRILLKDLAVDSPYNTYKYTGLPPGPIANPGKASIEAVLHPESHNYLYFVADGTGGHTFATNLSEHNQNVANWRKIRKSK